MELRSASKEKGNQSGGEGSVQIGRSSRGDQAAAVLTTSPRQLVFRSDLVDWSRAVSAVPAPKRGGLDRGWLRWT